MIKRESYMKNIRPFIGKDLIKVITGLRRSGKSVMLSLIQEEVFSSGVRKENIISYNFEDLKYYDLLNAKFLNDEIVSRCKNLEGKVYLFFDEIQEVRDWEKCINSLRVSLDSDIYITGSNAKLLSGELATYLGGRYVEFAIYPFSFSEFLEIYKLQDPSLSISDYFKKYLVAGGMPYLSNLGFSDEVSKLYLRDLFNSVQLKDIVKRNNVRDVDLLEKIILYIMANIGTSFSANTLVKFLKSEHRQTSVETVLNYIRFSLDSFMFFRIRREDLKGKQILSTNEKYYIVDHGIREAIYGNNMRDINLSLENIVFMEMLRRGYEVTVGKIGEKEIDFIGKKDNKKIYIQVTYLLADESTIAREFGVFRQIEDNWPKFVVSMDEIDMSRDGIRHWNIKDFLLSSKWN